MPKPVTEKLTPEYLDFLYRNTGGKMGKQIPKASIPVESIPRDFIPPQQDIPRYEAPSNGWRRALYAFGGGNPADIDQMQLAEQERNALDDPNSMRSKVARLLSSKIGGPTNEDLAARDINEYLPAFEKLAMMKSRGQGGPIGPKADKKTLEDYSERIAGLRALEQNQQLLKNKPDVTLMQELGMSIPLYSEYFKKKLSPEQQATSSEIEKNANLAVRGANAGYNVTDSDFARLSPLFASPYERNERAQEKNQNAILQEAQKTKARALDDLRFGRIDEGTFKNITGTADQILGGINQPIQNTSQGAGDITKEIWRLPDGSQKGSSAKDPDHQRFLEIMKRKGAKRIQ
jgi:hypothetical protein